MAGFDDFSQSLFEEAKRFLEKAAEDVDEGRTAYLVSVAESFLVGDDAAKNVGIEQQGSLDRGSESLFPVCGALGGVIRANEDIASLATLHGWTFSPHPNPLR